MIKLLLAVVFLLFLFISPVNGVVDATLPGNITENYTTTNKNMSWTITAASNDAGKIALWVSFLPANLGYSCTGNTAKAKTDILQYAPQQPWSGTSTTITYDVLRWIHEWYSVETLINNREITFDQNGAPYLCFEIRIFIIQTKETSLYFNTPFTIVKLTDIVGADDNIAEDAVAEVGGVFQNILPFNITIFLIALITLSFLRRKLITRVAF